MKNLFVLFFVIASIRINSQSDSTKNKFHFEVSFGQNLLFISSSQQVNIRAQQAVVLPTSALLFFVEFRAHKIARIPVFFNLATESKQFIVNGVLINEKASPTFGAGFQFKLFQIKIDSKSKLEFEMGPIASIAIDNDHHLKFAPLLAGRIRLMQGPNFIMYFGGSYSPFINTSGILYGTGTIF